MGYTQHAIKACLFFLIYPDPLRRARKSVPPDPTTYSVADARLANYKVNLFCVVSLYWRPNTICSWTTRQRGNTMRLNCVCIRERVVGSKSDDWWGMLCYYLPNTRYSCESDSILVLEGQWQTVDSLFSIILMRLIWAPIFPHNSLGISTYIPPQISKSLVWMA